MKKVTILLPAYNEEASFQLIRQNMNQVLTDNPNYEWEFLLVNDGSTDNTLQQMIRLHEEDHHYSYIDLSRNYGKEIAMMAGFDYADSDALIIMDADMQHPINVIPDMLKYWEEGYDDVYAQRQGSKESWIKRKTSHWYYKILQSTTKVPIQKDTGDFRLLDKSCIEALRQMRESERNTKGMYSWIGFRKKGIFYQQQERQEGVSKWNTFSLINLAINGITSFTTAPLRIASFMGVVVSVVAFFYLIYIIIVTNFFGEPVQGYPTIMVTMLFLGGVQLLSLGIIGEYLGRVFNEVKGRPGYFVNSYNGKRESVTLRSSSSASHN
ncbi:glycosyltransferase family 2 protein [uncultured Prevotella sp.]|jgi:glycosyltransferase involved in cell wall biosynthesis|uniref:glycosyltransferase family 2 protein n=1 Tax=uncultured Prevotella sp. TaxID=159272 RepID=UPI0025F68640|nr:glycosyltransferase family 2 protein [uncultured Prevotella sp.]